MLGNKTVQSVTRTFTKAIKDLTEIKTTQDNLQEEYSEKLAVSKTEGEHAQRILEKLEQLVS